MTTLKCPLGDDHSVIILGDTGWCTNDECKALCWNINQTIDELMNNLNMVDLNPLTKGDTTE